MSDEQNYRPRSPDVSAFQGPPPPRLNRLPSYPHLQDTSFPPSYSFSPRGSYDASPYFSPQASQPSSYFGAQPQDSHHSAQTEPPQDIKPPAHLNQQFGHQLQYPLSPQRIPQALPNFNSPVQAQPQYQPFNQISQSPQYSTPQSFSQFDNDMVRLRNRKQVNYNEERHDNDFEQTTQPRYQSMQSRAPPPPLPPQPQPQSHSQFQSHSQSMMQHPFMPAAVPSAMMQQNPIGQFPARPPQAIALQSVPAAPVDVKTKFPVARIKRIMQADEDVGKVAQATPTAVSKSLELFMIALVTKGVMEAKSSNNKRVTATHLKTALLNDSQFDFLNEICESVPDEGTKKGRAKSEAKSEESDEDIAGAPRRKGKAGKRKKTGDDSE